MRVTQFTQYNNFVLNQQNTLSELNDTQTQIATGTKIQNMYDDSSIYTKYLELDQEINSFTQIKSSASFAQTFANQTDTTLNDFVSTLGTFKTKLLQAASDTNDETSRQAIVSELEGELAHLKDLANTSIDGKYLFSGSKFNTKPIDDNYKYQGNDEHVKAFLGAGVEREYNISGSELFLGRDNDYKKITSTNIPQYDKMKQHPEFVVRGADGKLYIDKDNPNPDASGAVPTDEIITGESQIRMLTGVEDIDNGDGTYDDGTSYFYVKGKKPNGELINEKFSLKNSDTVNDLLTKIGELYGNTATSKVVDVSLNDVGEIVISDVNSGKMISDFFMVASDKDEASVDDLVRNGDYIVEFQKSNYPSIPTLNTITANNKSFDNRIFTFGAYFYNLNQKREALPQDKVFDVLGDINNIDHLKFSGTDTSGNSVDVNLIIDSNTTMQDIVNEIKNNFGDVDVKLENGEIVVTDNTIEKTETSNLSLKIEARNSSDNNIIYFTPKDSVNFDHLWMDKQDNLINGNYSNIIKDYKTYFKDGQKFVDINPNAQTYATEDTVVADTMGTDTMPQNIDITFKDKNGNLNNATITLDNNGSTFSVNGNTYHIYNQNGDVSPAQDIITTETTLDANTCEVCTTEKLNKGVTYRQLADIVSMITTGNLPANDTFEDYNNAINNAKKEVETGVDNKGRFFLKDLSNNPSKIDLSMYTNNNSLYFQANDAVTVDTPETDFFETLQKAIDAVSNGNFYPDSKTDPRNSGIEGAIKAIDHVTDHVRRMHAKIGAVSNEFQLTIDRTDMLTLNVQQLQSENIDTDIGEATMRLNSLTTSYQALLASIAKVNNLTLLNYLR